MISHCTLICVTLVADNVRYLFIYPLSICMLSFEGRMQALGLLSVWGPGYQDLLLSLEFHVSSG